MPSFLGDDIVSDDKALALEYRKSLDRLQVKISEAKSLVSERGHLEFAKLYWAHRLTKNLSPVSAKAVLRGYSALGIQELARKYPLSERVCMRLAGAGYRVLARLDTDTLSRRFIRTRALCSKHLLGSSGLPLEWWIGSGMPLSPYTKGVLVQMVRVSMKLRQLTLLPSDR